MSYQFTSTDVRAIMPEFDSVSKRAGVFIARRGYFYRHGATSEMYAKMVEKNGFEVIEHGDHYAAFRGGAPLA